MATAASLDVQSGLSEVVREANREVCLLALDGGAGPDEELDLTCACGRVGCGEHVLVTVEAYLGVLADADRFVVSPGHADVSPGHADGRLAVVVDRGAVYEVVRVLSAARTSS